MKMTFVLKIRREITYTKILTGHITPALLEVIQCDVSTSGKVLGKASAFHNLLSI